MGGDDDRLRTLLGVLLAIGAFSLANVYSDHPASAFVGVVVLGAVAVSARLRRKGIDGRTRDTRARTGLPWDVFLVIVVGLVGLLTFLARLNR